MAGCQPLAMFAMLFPEKLADAAMAQAESMANDPVPSSERPTRIAALEREIEELSRTEEALIEAAISRGETVHRSPWHCRRRYSASESQSALRAPPDANPRRTHAWAVPLGRWTAINSREPAVVLRRRGGHTTLCHAPRNIV